MATGVFKIVGDQKIEMTQEELDLINSSPVVVTPTQVVVYKSDIVRRATDDELDQLDAALSTVSSRYRLLFYSVGYLDKSDEDYPVIESIFNNLFGVTRASQLLAPSEG